MNNKGNNSNAVNFTLTAKANIIAPKTKYFICVLPWFLTEYKISRIDNNIKNITKISDWIILLYNIDKLWNNNTDAKTIPTEFENKVLPIKKLTTIASEPKIGKKNLADPSSDDDGIFSPATAIFLCIGLHGSRLL